MARKSARKGQHYAQAKILKLIHDALVHIGAERVDDSFKRDKPVPGANIPSESSMSAAFGQVALMTMPSSGLPGAMRSFSKPFARAFGGRGTGATPLKWRPLQTQPHTQGAAAGLARVATSLSMLPTANLENNFTEPPFLLYKHREILLLERRILEHCVCCAWLGSSPLS